MMNDNKKYLKIIGLIIVVLILVYAFTSTKIFSTRSGKVLGYKYTVLNSSDNISGPCIGQGAINKIEEKGYFVKLNEDDSITYHITAGLKHKESSEIYVSRVSKQKNDEEEILIVVKERTLLRFKPAQREVCPTVAIKFEKKPKHIKIINNKKEEFDYLGTK